MKAFCFGGRDAGPSGTLLLPSKIIGLEIHFGQQPLAATTVPSLALPCNAKSSSQHDN